MSTFVVQNATQLRDEILDILRAAAKEFGEEIDTTEDSDAYRMASAYALCTEVLHAHALKVEAAIFPDTALTEDLEHHALVYGLVRKPASAARLQMTVGNGGGVATFALTGQTLNHSNGTKYLPVDSMGAPLTSITTDAFGGATILVDAQSTGAATNLPTGYDLVWSSAPAGMNPTGEVTAINRSGADTETDIDFAARLLAYLRSRPAAGNCADWQSWALAVRGIAQAYVYPATNPTLSSTNDTPGSVTVLVLVDRATNNGVASAGDAANVFGYIEGTRDEDGNELSGDERSRQKRFCSLDPADIFVRAPTTLAQDVEMNITVKGESVGSWGPLVDAGGSTDTVIQVASTTGIVEGHWVAIESTLPGEYGWEVRRVQIVNPTSIKLDIALSAAPVAGATVRRAWPGWPAARAAVLDVFRGLGPGDFAPGTTGGTRYPDTTEIGPDRLYVSSLVAAVIGVARGSRTSSGIAGVVDAAVTTPASSIQASPLELIVPQDIAFVPSN